MNTLRLASVVAIIVTLLAGTPSQAISHTYVASHGSGASCSMTAPCNNFGIAANATDPGGQITCLDSVDVPGGVINRSVTIDCAGTSSVSGPFIINEAGIGVLIRNLTIKSGIAFLQGAALVVENCIITAAGIQFLPRTESSQLTVSNTLFINNDSGAAAGGVVVRPESGGSALVSLDRVTVANNVFGIIADGSRSTANTNITITNSTVHRNSRDGIIATTPTGGAPIDVLVKNTRSINNSVGIRSTGPNVTIRADNATVMHNGNGLVFNTPGALLSFGNNNVEHNGKNGTFSGRIALK